MPTPVWHKDLSVVNRAYAKFDASVDATGKVLFTLPKGAMIDPTSYVEVETAFNGTTPTVAIGTAGQNAALFASADVAPATVGNKLMVLATLNAGALNVPLAADTDIIVTLGGTGVTAGKVHAVVKFVHSNDPTTY